MNKYELYTIGIRGTNYRLSNFTTFGFSETSHPVAFTYAKAEEYFNSRVGKAERSYYLYEKDTDVQPEDFCIVKMKIEFEEV